MLTKNSEQILVAPEAPGRPAVPGSAFQLFAPPPGEGWRYNTPLPTNMGAFAQWKQLVKAAQAQEPNYLTFDQFVAKYGVNGGVSGWEPVLDGSSYGGPQPIIGFRRVPPVPSTQAWFSAPKGMTYMEARGAGSLAPNGFPLNGQDCDFYFHIAGVEYGARYRFDRARENYYFRHWLTPAPPVGHVMRGWTGVLAMPDIPGTPAVAGTPAVYRIETFDGWNSGANSAARLDGEVETTFKVDIKAAGAVGFAPSGGPKSGRLAALTHAFYFDTDASGTLHAAPMESGRVVGPRTPAPAGGTYTLRRVGGQVTFHIDDALIYTSATPSAGVLMVTTALYRGGDKVI